MTRIKPHRLRVDRLVFPLGLDRRALDHLPAGVDDPEAEAADAVLRHLAEEEGAFRWTQRVDEGAGHRVRRGQPDRDLLRFQVRGDLTGPVFTADVGQGPTGGDFLAGRPRVFSGAGFAADEGFLAGVSVRGRELEGAARVVGDVASELEALRRRARALHFLADDDRPRGRRRRHVVGVTEGVTGPGREGDRLDVVAVQIVDRATQGAESVFPGEGRPVEEDRVGRRSALDPETVAARAFCLCRVQLEGRRPMDRGPRDHAAVPAPQRRRRFGDDRGRFGSGDDRERAPRTAHRFFLDPGADRERQPVIGLQSGCPRAPWQG